MHKKKENYSTDPLVAAFVNIIVATRHCPVL